MSKMRVLKESVVVNGNRSTFLEFAKMVYDEKPRKIDINFFVKANIDELIKDWNEIKKELGNRYEENLKEQASLLYKWKKKLNKAFSFKK